MLDQELTQRLQQRKAEHLYRTRRTVQTYQAAEMQCDGQRYISFCSSDYLGLARHPDVIAAFNKAAQQYGVGSSASAVVSGYHAEHAALEEELAAFTQRPRALMFSTGCMANVGVVTALLNAQDNVFADKLSHASLIDAARFSGANLRRYLHGNVASLEKLLANAKARHTLVISDGIFSVDGDSAPLTELAATAKKHGAWLMVDDAHGFGVIGENGCGSVLNAGLTMQQVPILVGTFGKAFGTSGAFVAGSEALIEALIQFARFYVYTTALPPAIAAATRMSLRLLQQENWRRDHLAALIQRFKKGAQQLGLQLSVSDTPIQSITIGPPEKAIACGEALAKQGLFVGTMRPPTTLPQKACLRITLTALHTEAQVDQLLNGLACL